MTRPTHFTLRTTTAAHTIALARLIGAQLASGHVIALEGVLGAGKTTFTKGLALGLDVESGTTVKSPTFVLVHEYAGRLPLYHIDLYRLEQAAEVASLDLSPYIEGEGVCAIEWADKFPHLLPPAYLHVALVHQAATERTIRLTGYGTRYLQLLETIQHGLAAVVTRPQRR